MSEVKNSNIRSILKQAWDKARRNKKFYFLSSLLMVVIFLFTKFILFPQITFYLIDRPIQIPLILISIGLLNEVIFGLILFPLAVGLLMMGVNDGNKHLQDAIKIFTSYRDILKLGLGHFIISFFIVIAIILFLTHIRIYTFLIALFLIIYLPTYYSMFMPLILKEKLGFWTALKTSKRTISKNPNKAIGLYGVLLIILIASALPLGLGLIWTIPLCCEAYGIFYRELFQEKNNSMTLQKTSNFAGTDLF